MDISEKRVGLVLSGGMAKGAYQIGAFKSLLEYFRPDQIEAVSAASIGALNAYTLFGGKYELGLNMWKSINKMKDSVSLMTLLKSEYLSDCIKEMAKHTLMCKNLYVPLFNPQTKDTVYRDLCVMPHCMMEDYLRAAVAVFGVCKPHKIGNESFYDGALIDNIPMLPLENKRLDFIICIHFDDYNYVFDNPENDSKIIKITFGDNSNIIKNSIWFDKNEISRMISVGEERTRDILGIAFSGGFENEQIYKQIQVLNRLHPTRQVRITGDVAINNINKILKRMTYKKM